MLRRLPRVCLSAAGGAPPKTAVLMLNMGGPSSIPEVRGFLERIFEDRQLIELPFQVGRFVWGGSFS